MTRAVDVRSERLFDGQSLRQRIGHLVAHELRTPATALVSASELLDRDEAGLLVRRQVDRLRMLVEDLLEVSRLDQGHAGSPLCVVDLASATRRVVADQEGEGLSVEMRVVSSQGVPLDEARYARVLGNLLANVRRHGGGVACVTVTEREVSVEDDGPGLSADLLAQGPRRFHASGRGKGTGLGLTIAVKQAEVMGAIVQFGNRPGGGAKVSITWPENQEATS